MSGSIDRICVIGAGSMGHGIATEFATAGIEVSLVDQDDQVLHGARRRIDSALVLLEESDRIGIDQFEDVLGRISFSTDVAEGAQCADLIIEVVAEDLDLKQKVLVKAAEVAKSHAILASNTSSFQPGVIAEAIPRPERFAVTHYLNPPYLVPLVELVPGAMTSRDVIAELESFYRSIGKKPVCVKEEIAGSIANRLQIALLREALSLIEDGVADPEAIDTVVTNTIGRRLAIAGPFEIWEQIGWDLVQTIAAELLKEISSDTDLSSGLKEKVVRGELGFKSGSGYYDWTDDSIAEFDKRIAHALIELARKDVSP